MPVQNKHIHHKVVAKTVQKIVNFVQRVVVRFALMDILDHRVENATLVYQIVMNAHQAQPVMYVLKAIVSEIMNAQVQVKEYQLLPLLIYQGLKYFSHAPQTANHVAGPQHAQPVLLATLLTKGYVNFVIQFAGNAQAMIKISVLLVMMVLFWMVPSVAHVLLIVISVKINFSVLHAQLDIIQKMVYALNAVKIALNVNHRMSVYIVLLDIHLEMDYAYPACSDVQYVHKIISHVINVLKDFI